jgi:PIN domain nuclease of toxin-antitoxin system
VKLLLDTRAALWWLDNDERLGAAAARELVNEANRVMLSAVVIWEVAIKRSLGKLQAPHDLASILIGAGAQPLAITLDHAAAAEALPWHHRDPFDRMLVAQALAEDASIVSQDERLRRYGVQLVWE